MKCVVLPSQDGRIAVKACEGLMLLVSLPEPAAAKCLTQSTCLCELLTDRLASLYKALPQSMDPLDIETVEGINWGYVFCPCMLVLHCGLLDMLFELFLSHRLIYIYNLSYT